MTKEEFNAKWPMTKIPDAIRKVAVVWGDAHEWFIQDKVKLAQDILEATDKLLSEQAEQRSIDFTGWILNHELDFQPTAKNQIWIGVDMVKYSSKDLYKKFLSTL